MRLAGPAAPGQPSQVAGQSPAGEARERREAPIAAAGRSRRLAGTFRRVEQRAGRRVRRCGGGRPARGRAREPGEAGGQGRAGEQPKSLVAQRVPTIWLQDNRTTRLPEPPLAERAPSSAKPRPGGPTARQAHRPARLLAASAGSEGRSSSRLRRVEPPVQASAPCRHDRPRPPDRRRHQVRAGRAGFSACCGPGRHRGAGAAARKAAGEEVRLAPRRLPQERAGTREPAPRFPAPGGGGACGALVAQRPSVTAPGDGGSRGAVCARSRSLSCRFRAL